MVSSISSSVVFLYFLFFGSHLPGNLIYPSGFLFLVSFPWLYSVLLYVVFPILLSSVITSSILFLLFFVSRKEKGGRVQGVIQRKIADGSSRTARIVFKTFAGVSGLAKTASHNIFPEGEYIHEK